MIKKILLGLAILGTIIFSASIPALADTQSALQCGVNQAAGASCHASAGNSDLSGLVERIINILSVLVGAAAVIMLIVGGFRYVTSAGNESGVTAAKKTIMYAIIGLVIVMLAQVIVHFVIQNLGTAAKP